MKRILTISFIGLAIVVAVSIGYFFGIKSYAPQKLTVDEVFPPRKVATSTQNATSTPNATTTPKSTPEVIQTNNQDFSTDRIVADVAAYWKVNLVKRPENYYETPSGSSEFYYSIDKIAKGDINQDGLPDALAFGTWCNSYVCSSIYEVVINNGDLPDRVIVKGFPGFQNINDSNGTQYLVDSISIADQVITINARVPSTTKDQSTPITLKYRLLNDEFIRIQ